jgi:hypothetical protein
MRLVMQESMRLQPVVAQPLRRVAVRDVRLSNGVLIPAGAGIELASYSIARSAAWGWVDGEAYKPVRSLPAPFLMLQVVLHLSPAATGCPDAAIHCLWAILGTMQVGNAQVMLYFTLCSMQRQMAMLRPCCCSAGALGGAGRGVLRAQRLCWHQWRRA